VLREGQTAAFEFTVTQDEMAAFAGAAGLLTLLAADYNWLHVDTVSPGFVETNLLNAFDQRFLELLRERPAFRQSDDVAGKIFAKIK
jgi:hypothetical protein